MINSLPVHQLRPKVMLRVTAALVVLGHHHAMAGCPAGTYFEGTWQTGTRSLDRAQKCAGQATYCQKAECRDMCLATPGCTSIVLAPNDAGNYIEDSQLCFGAWEWGGECKCARCAVGRSCTYCGQYCSTMAIPRCSACPAGTISSGNGLSQAACSACPSGKYASSNATTCSWDPMVIVMITVVGVLMVGMLVAMLSFVLLRGRRFRRQQPQRYSEAPTDEDSEETYMALEPEEPPPPYEYDVSSMFDNMMCERDTGHTAPCYSDDSTALEPDTTVAVADVVSNQE